MYAPCTWKGFVSISLSPNHRSKVEFVALTPV